MTKIFALFLTLLIANIGYAEARETPSPTPIVPHVTPSAPNIQATAYVLVDFDSGKTIASKDPESRIEPASLTKIMTGYVVISELKNGTIQMNDEVTISTKAWQMPGSRMFIEVGKKVTVQDLIKGMVIQSGNDASVALAEHVAGSEEVFAELMNRYAQSLDMTDTHYVNATGLPHPDHYTTAKDLAILTKALIKNFPDEYKWYSEKKFTYNGITQYNRNKLLWQDASVDGLKTGHTESAGYCLVTSAKRDNMRLISVLLGAESAKQRVQESQKLLNYGFRFFETHKLYAPGQRLNEARIWEGKQDMIELGLTDSLHVTIPRGQYKNLVIESSIDAQITAPVKKGQALGKLYISFNNEVLIERPLVALNDVEEGSFFKKIIDQIKQLLSRLFGFLGL
ncbi:MAG: serine-type D-Ala-D-Ala carboxypeptidase [Piscirickettsiaceae bacterium CG_4_9_14_3_um_filter_43_564]|nr:D-alanyl-D-alanine carboxypeptidase [Thiomicrospira sp.]OIP94042.1 MAG: serine-type D-Ala-D-Ala carboxypeptidase [Thiomicrospira sp. CG2_30_44_34]PIQ05486.1 MAG: serine-type D-Ala-D-Ala carboxypeptidase [Piscirickettsiaceae bacterium CG18_big_fil_WC_8_21_14_2_50_44_103]PIU39247.1 MAG: serine-type D-Ala-D-Ala carboxypeptidase [Piscirickettsiaceae bacterium CG07_land_8_20_14_0_80_44_28]PIW58284.1 MAG: serine-type D-Ala-D-Ala carboxypeptidase [Piscirickettsiaceae bacterium CG12_big_fil_rev_8_21